MKYFTLISLCLLISCNITLSNVSTHGTASDVVDEEESATPTISPTVTLPISPV